MPPIKKERTVRCSTGKNRSLEKRWPISISCVTRRRWWSSTAIAAIAMNARRKARKSSIMQKRSSSKKVAAPAIPSTDAGVWLDRISPAWEINLQNNMTIRGCMEWSPHSHGMSRIFKIRKRLCLKLWCPTSVSTAAMRKRWHCSCSAGKANSCRSVMFRARNPLTGLRPRKQNANARCFPEKAHFL